MLEIWTKFHSARSDRTGKRISVNHVWSDGLNYLVVVIYIDWVHCQVVTEMYLSFMLFIFYLKKVLDGLSQEIYVKKSIQNKVHSVVKKKRLQFRTGTNSEALIS